MARITITNHGSSATDWHTSDGADNIGANRSITMVITDQIGVVKNNQTGAVTTLILPVITDLVSTAGNFSASGLSTQCTVSIEDDTGALIAAID